MLVYYTCVNELDALMPLDTLLGNFAASEADVRPDAEIRAALENFGWFADNHQNGCYLIITEALHKRLANLEN